MTREQNIKIYNKLVNFLFEVDCFFSNTGARYEYGEEIREFEKAGVKLRQAIEKKI